MFGERLRELRVQGGLSQEELGEIMDVSRQAISKYENETAEPNLEKLLKAAAYFQVTMDYLVGVDEGTAEESVSVRAGSNRLSIVSKVNGQLSSYYKFEISKVAFKKDYNPAALLLGVESSSFWGEQKNTLGWYETIEDAEKELTAIQQALQTGRTVYQLAYDVAVIKKGLFDVQMTDYE